MDGAISQYKKIAIFRALQLGDLLCAMPAIKNLRMAYPGAELVFIGLPSARKLIERYPELFDRFIDFSGYPGLPEIPFDAKSFSRFCKSLASEAFDMILQMQGNGTIVNEMLRACSGGSTIAGFSVSATEMAENSLLMPYPNWGHESLRHIALMKHLGIAITTTAMFFPLHQTDFENLDALAIGNGYICMHCGSRGSWRQWPPAFFAKLADYCTRQALRIVLTGTSEELEIINQVAALMDEKPIILAGKTDLGMVGALLKRSNGLISNCTGISHIAAALRVKSVVISMDGEPERWGPIDTTRHKTIDWTKTPDYALVEQAVKQLLFHEEDHQKRLISFE
ncbi:glycosyltransferase family 9 protein [Pedobacter sp. KLB.chiD]|uniref:glycosyltransferase family 9 protein n=1 Tax=Pedobacter sp. KLB.chiD TaxID=3387402 RepID=UPI00399AEFFC